MSILRRIKRLGFLMAITLNVTGCLSPHISSNDVKGSEAIVDKNEQLLLSIKEGRGYLYRSDYLRLIKFITTAKPQETIRWRTYSMQYTLISQSVFMDGNARPCRRYQLKATSFLPFTKSIACTETACRCTDGEWRTVS